MHLGGLDDRARRRDEPVEARRRVERGDRPRGRVAGRDALDRREVPVAPRRGRRRARAPRAASSSAVRAPRKPSGRQKTITPTLIRSPRSTSRHEAHDRVRERAQPRARSASSTNPRGASSRREQVVDVDAAAHAVRATPPGRARRRPRAARRHARGEPRVGLGDRRRVRQQHVVADRLEAAARVLGDRRRRRGGSRAPRRGRSARAGRARRAGSGSARVRSTFVTSASSQTTSAAKSGSGAGPGRRAERQRAGQEVDAEVEPALASSRSWISGSGSARPIAASSSTSDELRHRQPERARELAGDHLGDERLRPLPRRRGT